MGVIVNWLSSWRSIDGQKCAQQGAAIRRQAFCRFKLRKTGLRAGRTVCRWLCSSDVPVSDCCFALM